MALEIPPNPPLEKEEIVERLLVLQWRTRNTPHSINFQKFLYSRGNFKSPQLVIPNEVRNLKGIGIKRFLPLVEMTIDAFLSFEITSVFIIYSSILAPALR